MGSRGQALLNMVYFSHLIKNKKKKSNISEPQKGVSRTIFKMAYHAHKLNDLCGGSQEIDENSCLVLCSV